MIRKTARLRREYLYRKSLQTQERERLDRKVRIREALQKGTPISETDLQAEAKEQEYALANAAAMEDPKQKQLALDNEYATAGASDPKILITSAREPSDRLKRFLKELRFVFPNSQRMNRGGQQIKGVVEAAVANGFTDLIMVHETRGEPDSFVVCHLPYGPTATFTMFNTVMRHDTDSKTKVSEAYPHLIFHNFKTKLGERVASILKYLFPVPKEDSKRVMTFANDNDFISFRHHVYKKEEGKLVLREIGPRFELQLYQIRLGTIDQKDGDLEWVLRPYMNSASKRQAIGKTKDELLAIEEEERNRILE